MVVAHSARLPAVRPRTRVGRLWRRKSTIAFGMALPLLLITVALLWMQRVMLARKGYTVVSGKGGERRVVRLGPWRWVMFGYALLICALSVFMPLIVLVQASFSKAWGRGFALANLTLENFQFILFEHQGAQIGFRTEVFALRRKGAIGRARGGHVSPHRHQFADAGAIVIGRREGLVVHGSDQDSQCAIVMRDAAGRQLTMPYALCPMSMPHVEDRELRGQRRGQRAARPR